MDVQTKQVLDVLAILQELFRFTLIFQCFHLGSTGPDDILLARNGTPYVYLPIVNSSD